MDIARQFLMRFGAVIISSLIYLIITFILSAILNEGLDRDVEIGGWFSGGILFVIVTMLLLGEKGLF